MNEKQMNYLDILRMKVNGQKEFLHEAAEQTELCEVVKTQMQRAYLPWRSAYLEFHKRYSTPMGNVELTDPIHQLDTQRDSLLFAIEVAARAAQKSIDPEMVAAGKAIDQARISFPVDPNTGYLSQTAQLDFYLGELLGAQLENLTKIGALVLAQNLRAINEQIHALINERDDERNEQSDEPGRTAARTAAVMAWDYLRRYVNGYNLVVVDPQQPNVELNNYIGKMNVKIKRYKGLYLNGTTTKPDKEEGDEDDEVENGGEGGNPNDPSSPSDPNNPNNPNNPSNPGTGSGSGNDNQEPTLVTMLYLYHDNTEDTRRGEPGTRLVSPEPDAGYEWQPTPPNVFPDTDRTFTEVEIEDNGEGDGDDDAGFGR